MRGLRRHLWNAANPTVGVVADWLVAQGATVLLGETAEFFGAEQTLARRARDKETAQRLYEIVARLEAEAQYVGESVAGAATPTATDESGGRTEAALGCIRKGGTTEVQEVVGFSDRPTRAGLVVMDTPSHDTVALTGMVTGGAQLCIATTGRGSPVGNALAPVINVTANPRTAARMGDNIDLSLAGIVEGTATPDALAAELTALTIEVARGELTAAEIIGHEEFALYRIGPQV